MHSIQGGFVSPFLAQVVLFLRADYLDAKPLVQKEIDALAPDPHGRTNAINFLLAAVRMVYMPMSLC